MIYSFLGRLLPQRQLKKDPHRIILLRPCCIGDVVMATAALTALRETFPQAHITWAVGRWSAPAIARHPALDAILDTGEAALPWRTPRELLNFIARLRAGNYDLAISLVRSPVMSAALLLAGIPLRAGLDSAGRGFGYNLRVPVDPAAREHEGAIYLRLVSAIAGRPLESFANLPLHAESAAAIEKRLQQESVEESFIVAHPGGGKNPGMSMDSKRYPLPQLADMLNRLAAAQDAAVILVGGPDDAERVADVVGRLTVRVIAWVGELSFREIGALAKRSLLYLGNDTGMTHLAAASGAATVMMMGPSDPQRYAPFTADHLVLWNPAPLGTGGVDMAPRKAWNWHRDGFTVDDGVAQILDFLEKRA